MGDREKNINDAIDLLSQIDNLCLKALSRIYETEPVGYKEQGRFLNMVVKLETEIEPFKLLEQIHKIEASLKRIREIRWGPRTIDIDILLYGGLQINTPELTIPHARMYERAFVLIPLKEILGVEEISECNIDSLINLCSDKDDVLLWNNTK